MGVGLQFSCAAVLHLNHRALTALGGFRKDRGPGLAVVEEAFMGRLEMGDGERPVLYSGYECPSNGLVRLTALC